MVKFRKRPEVDVDSPMADFAHGITESKSEDVSLFLLEYAMDRGLLRGDSVEVGENLMFIIIHTHFLSVMQMAFDRLVSLRCYVVKKEIWFEQLQGLVNDGFLIYKKDEPVSLENQPD